MTLEEQYKKETNLEAYELDTLNNGYDNFKYMKWLEAKINYTRCCTGLCDECSRENHLQKLTDQAQDLDLGY